MQPKAHVFPRAKRAGFASQCAVRKGGSSYLLFTRMNVPGGLLTDHPAWVDDVADDRKEARRRLDPSH